MKDRKFSDGLLNNDLILASLNIRPGQAVLDAGCGSGYMTVEFSRLVGPGGAVYALDKDPVFVDAVKKECEGRPNIVALIGDITQRTDLEESSVDLIYLSTVWHIFSGEQIAGFDREANRLLKPGGQLAIVNIHKRETPFGPAMEIRSSPEELRQKLSFTPTKLVEVGEHFYMQVFNKKTGNPDKG